jgi:uncharacterized membrane protein YbaN (DUF454 family)
MSIIPENVYSHSAIKQKGWILRRKRFGKKFKKWLTESGVWGRVCKCFGCVLKTTCSCCVVTVTAQ